MNLLIHTHSTNTKPPHKADTHNESALSRRLYGRPSPSAAASSSRHPSVLGIQQREIIMGIVMASEQRDLQRVSKGPRLDTHAISRCAPPCRWQTRTYDCYLLPLLDFRHEYFKFADGICLVCVSVAGSPFDLCDRFLSGSYREIWDFLLHVKCPSICRGCCFIVVGAWLFVISV